MSIILHTGRGLHPLCFLLKKQSSCDMLLGGSWAYPLPPYFLQCLQLVALNAFGSCLFLYRLLLRPAGGGVGDLDLYRLPGGGVGDLDMEGEGDLVRGLRDVLRVLPRRVVSSSLSYAAYPLSDASLSSYVPCVRP